MKVTDSPLAGRLWAIATALLVSYTGYGEYEKATSAPETTVNVNVEGIDSAPTATALSREAIEALIAASIARQHKADLMVFKQKESWEK